MTAELRASYRRTDEYNYQGVLRVGSRVIWTCDHEHQLQKAWRPSWHGTMTAIACAEQELKRRQQDETSSLGVTIRHASAARVQEDEPWRYTRCAHCGKAFEKTGDNWYRLTRMHQDRTGAGPYDLCSKVCAIFFLDGQDEI